jgi:L-fuculose-phosphate aldolase
VAERTADDGSIAEAVADTMRRVYARGLTTLSGGNVSCRDDRGSVWITPGGRPKDAVQGAEVVVIEADGTVGGRLAPSSETPLHRCVYERREDVRAIIHAHPPALVAHSVARRLPEIQALPAAAACIGPVVSVAYALTGTRRLGELIGEAFSDDTAVAMLESHGVVVGSADLDDALRRLETLEMVARIVTVARRLLGADPAPARAVTPDRGVGALVCAPATDARDEDAASTALTGLVARAARRELLVGALATASIRAAGDVLLMTPAPFDPERLDPGGLRRVAIDRAADPASARHAAVYRAHPAVHVIVEATPVHATAFALAGAAMSTRTIPESVMLLGDGVPVIGPGDANDLAQVVSSVRPAALEARRGAVVLGAHVDEALDRLEVIEATARTHVAAAALGGATLLDEAQVAELAEAMARR